jgi:hypothetical protein
MKKLFILFIVFVLTSTWGFAQTNKGKKDTAHQQYYTCPMDSDVVTNKPGICPKCGMTLVEKKGGTHMDSSMHKMPMHHNDSMMHKMPMHHNDSMMHKMPMHHMDSTTHKMPM